MVAPQPIENLLKCDPFISQAVLIGDRRKFISALIAADPQRLAAYAKEKGIPYTDLAELQDDPRIVELYRQCVAEGQEIPSAAPGTVLGGRRAYPHPEDQTPGGGGEVRRAHRVHVRRVTP